MKRDSLIAITAPKCVNPRTSVGFCPAALRGAALLIVWFLAPASHVFAQDADNCLFCHQFPGLSRIDAESGRVRLFYVDPAYVHSALGPHARLSCTDCHARSEVGVVPHRELTPVDCTRQCHLARPGAPERRFSHENIARLLEQGVHRVETLATLTFSGAPPLAPQQSKCLYCHDEPVFRLQTPLTMPDATAPTARCESCHATQLPIDAEYSLKHVSARLQHARPSLELAQTCSVCHSDPRILAQRGAEDAIASYARSFHGKAVLLGDQSAANCIDCHVGAGQNVHAMLGPADPASSVNSANVAEACVRCHTDASVTIAATAVHANLPRSGGSIDYLIAAAFILITLVTFVPSALLVTLELGQLVVGRHAHGHEALRGLADAVWRHPDGPARLSRFTPSQRVQHWVLALLFGALVLTGFPMKFADQVWASVVVDKLGGLSVARAIHHWAGVALLLGVLLHLGVAVLKTVRDARRTGADGRRIGLLRAACALPMVMSPEDLRRTGRLLGYLVGLRRERPMFGRFSASEKFEYFGVLWGTVLLGVTGLLLWGEQWVSHLLGGRVFNFATIFHTYEAFLAVIHVGILHICSVMLSPLVFPLSRATLTGRTPAAKLAEDNGEFLLAAAQDLGISAAGGPLRSELPRE